MHHDDKSADCFEFAFFFARLITVQQFLSELRQRSDDCRFILDSHIWSSEHSLRQCFSVKNLTKQATGSSNYSVCVFAKVDVRNCREDVLLCVHFAFEAARIHDCLAAVKVAEETCVLEELLADSNLSFEDQRDTKWIVLSERHQHVVRVPQLSTIDGDGSLHLNVLTCMASETNRIHCAEVERSIQQLHSCSKETLLMSRDGAFRLRIAIDVPQDAAVLLSADSQVIIDSLHTACLALTTFMENDSESKQLSKALAEAQLRLSREHSSSSSKLVRQSFCVPFCIGLVATRTRFPSRFELLGRLSVDKQIAAKVCAGIELMNQHDYKGFRSLVHSSRDTSQIVHYQISQLLCNRINDNWSLRIRTQAQIQSDRSEEIDFSLYQDNESTDSSCTSSDHDDDSDSSSEEAFVQSLSTCGPLEADTVGMECVRDVEATVHLRCDEDVAQFSHNAILLNMLA